MTLIATWDRPALSAQAIALTASLVVCFAAMAAGGLATASSVREWYPTLDKPSWTPPSYWFGIVWPVLYLLMAIAAWLVWRERGAAGARWPLVLFGVQLSLNVAWSYLFFGLRAPGWAAIEIVVLWFAIAATVVVFWRVRPLAGALLVPYLAWVAFASALNLSLWQRNGTIG